MTWARSISTGRPPAEGEPSPEWHTKPQPSLEEAIARFKAALPGWWYSVCECQVSCDATVAPTAESPDIALVEHGNDFDGGFSVDLYQPSTLAEALITAMNEALAAKAALAATA
jgi:hypothetical protein